MDSFIDNLKDVYDELDVSTFSLDTQFRENDEWSSLHALAMMSMIEIKYGVNLNAEELKNVDTIRELILLIESKKQ